MISKIKTKNIKNIIGYNFRMGEIEAAIGIEQLKLPKILSKIQNNAKLLNNSIETHGIIVPKVDKTKFTHSYYTYGITIDLKTRLVEKNCKFIAKKEFLAAKDI